ncbi:MAG: argininosuccinate synthase [Bacillota bacterium]|nr:argininosuccinate synthase [Bacillota bacterium]
MSYKVDKNSIKKVALAYSGGLDTSVIIPWLKDNYHCEVIAICGDVGQNDDMAALEKKALASGASKCYIGDLTEEFITDYIYPTLKAGAVYEGKYLLGTAMARPLIARYLVEIALKENCDAICHGCTGKGNDQVRFELGIKAFAPQMKIIAPWREWELTSRDKEIDYAEAHGIPIPVTKKDPYSRDCNIWHISHEGADLENPWNQHKQGLLQFCAEPEQAPDQPEFLVLDFEQGIPVKLNGEALGPIEMLTKLNAIGAKHGVGVDDMVENRLVGMKSRGIYENPGGTILYAAHKALESITLDRDTAHYKEQIALKYAEMVYYGQCFLPLKKALDAFVDVTQEHVSGTVKVKLYKGSVFPAGVQSEHSLYDEELATFGEDEIYDQSDSAGFINLFGLPLTMLALRNAKLK